MSSPCTCPECGHTASEDEFGEFNAEDMAPDLADFGACPACEKLTPWLELGGEE